MILVDSSHSSSYKRFRCALVGHVTRSPTTFVHFDLEVQCTLNTFLKSLFTQSGKAGQVSEGYLILILLIKLIFNY